MTTPKPMTRYKFLRASGDTIHSHVGHVTWTVNGAWKEVLDAPELCVRGFHCSARPLDALRYIRGEILALVEVDGACDKGSDKEAWQRMRILKAWRWRKKDSVAMAIYAAELVIGLFEQRYPEDSRPRQAIEAVKEWQENPFAYADAAYAAATYGGAAEAADAARAAYSAAASCAYAAEAAAYTACAAARAAYADADTDAAARAADAAGYAAAAGAAVAESDVDKQINAWMEARIAVLEPLVAIA